LKFVDVYVKEKPLKRGQKLLQAESVAGAEEGGLVGLSRLDSALKVRR
jgi:hypothetical protein